MNTLRATLSRPSTSFRTAVLPRFSALPPAPRLAAQAVFARRFASETPPSQSGLDQQQQKARDQSTVGVSILQERNLPRWRVDHKN